MVKPTKKKSTSKSKAKSAKSKPKKHDDDAIPDLQDTEMASITNDEDEEHEPGC